MYIAYINIDGSTTDNGCISVDMGYLYGYGIFETIKVMNNSLVFFNEHYQRLIESLLIVGIKISESIYIIKKRCMEVIEKNNIVNGAVRLTVSIIKEGYNIVITSRANSYTEETYKKGFDVKVSDFKRNENGFLVSMKSNNYMENFLILQKAKTQGYHEALFFNNKGYLAEGTMSNVFLIKNNKCYTPAEDCGILSGIMRRKIIELIIYLGLIVEEGNFTMEDLYEADEVFICNSLMDIMPVKRVLDKEYILGNDTHTKYLMKEFKKMYYENQEVK